MGNYVRLIVRCCFCCIPPSWRLIFVLQEQIKNSVWTKAVSWIFLHDARALPAWSIKRRRRWSKKPWNETRPSSQGRTGEIDGNLWIFRVVRNLSTKNPWWWGGWGPLGRFGCICPCIGLRVLFFNENVAWYTSNGNQATVKHGFLSKLFTASRYFCHLFLKNPTVRKGAKWGPSFALVQGLKNSEDSMKVFGPQCRV